MNAFNSNEISDLLNLTASIKSDLLISVFGSISNLDPVVQKLFRVSVCESSVRFEGNCEVWVRWELNCTACLCQIAKTLAVQQDAKWELTAVGLREYKLQYSLSGVPVLSKPVTVRVNLHLPLVTAYCNWFVRSGRCKDFSSWHLV